MSKLMPKQDYLLVEVIEDESAIVKTEDIRDHKSKGKVLAVGPGVWDRGVFIKTTTKVGEIVYWEEMAESNTPEVFKKKDQYLIKEARLVAAEVEEK